MSIILRPPTSSETIQLHDSYFHSDEPDAPKMIFSALSEDSQSEALKQFSPENHLAACKNDEVVGFVGVYPDDSTRRINIFSVIVPEHRGKKYFPQILSSLISYCRNHFPTYNEIRSLTRKSNTPAIKGLLSASFIYKGSCIEEYSSNPEDDIEYEEYVLPL